MSGLIDVFGTYAGSTALRPDSEFTPARWAPLPPQADSNGPIATSPAAETAAFRKLLRFNSLPMAEPILHRRSVEALKQLSGRLVTQVATDKPVDSRNPSVSPSKRFAASSDPRGFHVVTESVSAAERLPFRDPALSTRKRIDDLLGRLTLDERIAMLHQYSPAVPRLGVAAFRTGSEALHGVAWLGVATVFPQAVGLGATWDEDLVHRVAEATSVELRAFHYHRPTAIGTGRNSLQAWAPVLNLLRDPRWGRNEEGYSEDPLHTARLGIAFCRGLTGDHPRFLRAAP